MEKIILPLFHISSSFPYIFSFFVFIHLHICVSVRNFLISFSSFSRCFPFFFSTHLSESLPLGHINFSISLAYSPVFIYLLSFSSSYFFISPFSFSYLSFPNFHYSLDFSISPLFCLFLLLSPFLSFDAFIIPVVPIVLV